MEDIIEEYRDELLKVIRFLEDRSPARLSISAISRELGINRVTLTKYLEMLRLSGDVSMVPYGRSKQYTIARRVTNNMLLDVYLDSIVMLDAECHVKLASKKFLSDLGIPQGKNIIGSSVFDLNLNIFSDTSVRKNIRRMINGLIYAKEIQYIEESTNRVFRVIFLPMIAEHGPQDILIKISDITDQMHREEEITLTDKRLEVIFEKSLDGILFIDKDGSVLNFNKAAHSLFGINSSRFVANMNIFDFICDKEPMTQLLNKGIMTTMCTFCDFDRMRRIGKIETNKSGIIHVEIIFAPINIGNTGGDISEFAVIIKDITPEIQIIRELKKNEALYHSLFEKVCNAMFIIRPTSDVNCIILVDMNKAAEDLMNIKKEDFVGKNIYEIFPGLSQYKASRTITDRLLIDDEPVIYPPVKYFNGSDEPWFTHYLFGLPSGDIATFIIDTSGVRIKKLMEDIQHLKKLKRQLVK
jgi:PAS domain S-box-containing protein